MKTYEEFKNEIYKLIETHPTDYRKGQSVFNAVEELYGSDVARYVQFEDGVDCFYDDDMIKSFLVCCYNRYLYLENLNKE